MKYKWLIRVRVRVPIRRSEEMYLAMRERVLSRDPSLDMARITRWSPRKRIGDTLEYSFLCEHCDIPYLTGLAKKMLDEG